MVSTSHTLPATVTLSTEANTFTDGVPRVLHTQKNPKEIERSTPDFSELKKPNKPYLACPNDFSDDLMAYNGWVR